MEPTTKMISRVVSFFSLLWLALKVSTNPLSPPRRASNPSSGADSLSRRDDTAAYPPIPQYDVNTCSRNSYTLKSNDNGTWPYREYKTVNITSPIFKMSKNDQPLANGLIFLTLSNSGLYGYAGLKQQGATIMTPEGDLVWSGPEGDTSNLRTQTLYNQTVLTTWSGHGSAASGHGSGIVTIYDTHYETLYTICPLAKALNISNTDPDSCVADVHESYITDSSTILVTVYNISSADLSSVGGPKNGYVRDSLVVELDIETNEILWVWNPQDHVLFSASHSAVSGLGTSETNPWDWLHINSIQSFRQGYLINSRGTWSSYFVSREGDIEWELNGETGGDFGELPEGYDFSWQHHARLHSYSNSTSEVLFTVFNDANANISTKTPSSGLALILNLDSKSVSPYLHLNSSTPLVAFAEGSHTILENGNRFVGYGTVPYFQEFGADGDLRYSAQFAYNNHNNTGSSYRAFKSEWHAVPDEREFVLVVERREEDDTLSECAGGERLRGYVSWNGATDVERYVVYDGDDVEDLVQNGVVFGRKAFETEFVVREGNATYIQVAAWMEDQEVGRSNVVKVDRQSGM